MLYHGKNYPYLDPRIIDLEIKNIEKSIPGQKTNKVNDLITHIKNNKKAAEYDIKKKLEQETIPLNIKNYNQTLKLIEVIYNKYISPLQNFAEALKKDTISRSTGILSARNNYSEGNNRSMRMRGGLRKKKNTKRKKSRKGTRKRK